MLTFEFVSAQRRHFEPVGGKSTLAHLSVHTPDMRKMETPTRHLSRVVPLDVPLDIPTRLSPPAVAPSTDYISIYLRAGGCQAPSV